MKTKLIATILIFAFLGSTYLLAPIAAADTIAGINFDDLSGTWVQASTDPNALAYGSASSIDDQQNIVTSTAVDATSTPGHADASAYSTTSGDAISLTAGAFVAEPGNVYATGKSSVNGDQTEAGMTSVAGAGNGVNVAGVEASGHGTGDVSGYTQAHAHG